MYRLFTQRNPRIVEIHIVGYASNWNENHPPTNEYANATLNLLKGKILGLPAHVKEITIRLNCTGGSVHIAVGLYQLLKHSRFKVTTITQNLALSAGATLMQCGHHRQMASDGILMLHPPILEVDLKMFPNGEFKFTMAGLNEYAAAMEHANREQYRVFTERTGRTAADIHTLDERHLNAHEALAANLIDEIIDVPPLPITHKPAWMEMYGPSFKAALARRPAGVEQPISV